MQQLQEEYGDEDDYGGEGEGEELEDDELEVNAGILKVYVVVTQLVGFVASYYH